MAAGRAAFRKEVAAAVAIQAGWRGAACRVALGVAVQAATEIEAVPQGHSGLQELVLPAGSAVIFNDSVLHGSMQRTNPGQRRTLVFRYLELDFDDTKTAKIATDGLMPSAGMFLLSWILSYNAA